MNSKTTVKHSAPFAYTSTVLFPRDSVHFHSSRDGVQKESFQGKMKKGIFIFVWTFKCFGGNIVHLGHPFLFLLIACLHRKWWKPSLFYVIFAKENNGLKFSSFLVVEKYNIS